MAIPVQFQQFKSAGIYRVVYDRSTVLGTEAELLRLVVGYSPKGPFNTPVYVKSVSDFRAMFGGISKALEKRGCFFHRTCIHALEAGPILALNLKPFDEEEVGCAAISDAGINATDPKKVTEIYDTSRFWTLEPEKLNDKQAYFHIAATDSKETSTSIIVRKPADSKVAAYNISVADWYNAYNLTIPDFLEGSENKMMKDFFTEVYVFKGEFTKEIINAGALKNYFDITEGTEGTPEVPAYYTDANGARYEGDVIEVEGETYKASDVTEGLVNEGAQPLDYHEAVPVVPGIPTSISVKKTIDNAFGQKMDALDALFNDNASGALAHYVGTLIPELVDPNVGYISIDVLMNEDSDITNLMASLDDDMLYTDLGIANAGVMFNNFAATNTTNLTPVYLEGFTYLSGKPEDATVASKAAWQASILNVLSTEEGLRNGLLSQAEIDYRYIVDSFETYPAALGSTDEIKAQLSYLAKSKELCFAILNYPSVRAMVAQGYKDDKGIFDVEKATKILLPSESNGASFCAFYTPLKFSDGYVDTIVPSAGLVSNLFMGKYNGRFAYSIVAGPNYGNISYQQLVGPDYHYSQEELHVIEPYGVNCMIYRPTFGTFINANQTAKQTPKSALSSINVRELVIFLQSEIGKILQSYQWEFNNPVTRSAIKTKADIICAQAKANGGIQQFLNIMDESNNTPDIIDNEMCVLSTHIEPGRGMGKMIHELTIYRTGGMSAVLKGA